MIDKAALLDLTTDIVSSYVTQNAVAPEAMPEFIKSIYAVMDELGNAPEEPAKVKLVPAVPVEESITDDYLICLEDGKQFKSLKRHLRTKFDLSPEAYREKWNLPLDYPMVAPSYAKERSKLAKKMGLGKSEG